jgi:hypothetical protein
MPVQPAAERVDGPIDRAVRARRLTAHIVQRFLEHGRALLVDEGLHVRMVDEVLDDLVHEAPERGARRELNEKDVDRLSERLVQHAASLGAKKLAPVVNLGPQNLGPEVISANQNRPSAMAPAP